MIGGIFRRWWGGWHSPNGTVKRVAGFVLPLIICAVIFKLSWLSLIIPSLVLFGWLMPGHGYGIGMGSNADHPRWACLLVMGLQYGGLTATIGVAWNLLAPGTGGLIYAPLGLLVPFGYWTMNVLWSKCNWKPWGNTQRGIGL
jgi:hypothetical protein